MLSSCKRACRNKCSDKKLLWEPPATQMTAGNSVEKAVAASESEHTGYVGKLCQCLQCAGHDIRGNYGIPC